MQSWLLATATGGETYGIDIAEVLTHASLMVQAVLFFLAAMSVVCWFIIGYKWFFFRRSMGLNRRFLDLFWSSRHLDQVRDGAADVADAPLNRVFQGAYAELNRFQEMKRSGEAVDPRRALDNVERAVRRSTAEELYRTERMISVLGTTGSTAPFIGLFGTVWGIVEAFDRIPKQSGGVILDKVAGPMAHALIATAVGLLAAIPAVMAYNYFVRKVKVASGQLESFSDEFLTLVRRHFEK